MDGLLIAEQLRRLAGLLPAERRPWRFPDDRTAVLPLASGLSLWFYSRPPRPVFEVRDGAPAMSPASTPFQEQLAARAVGSLVVAAQPQLDRVVRLGFAAGDGFVPEPPISLIAELTGRNANLILTDASGTILGVERLVLTKRNRYRELRPGVRYLPPPPYEKIDPVTASQQELAVALRGRDVREVPKLVDGIGPQLFGVLVAGSTALEPGTELDGRVLDELVGTLKAVAREPSAALAATVGTGKDGQGDEHDDAHSDLETVRNERRLSRARTPLRTLLERRLKLAARRVADADKALGAGADGERLRAEADLLLANAAAFDPHGEIVSLQDYQGGTLVIAIDPRLDAAGNAAARYERAKRRETRARRAVEELPALRQEFNEVEAAVAGLADADERGLELLQERWGTAAEEVAEKGRRAAGNARSGAKAHPGVRFVDPRGYEVFVGRSAKENDAITFKLARSRDLWLHVQGYRGAHVVVRNQGRELPFDTLLFAARLAAGFSQARHSDNVPVDYTERKNVWRPKGAPAGAVNFAHNKTVYVTPARDDGAAAASQ